MNFELPYIPSRPEKPREKGLTMMMDKGLSVRQTEDFIESAGHLTDVIKFGFGTSLVTNRLEDKIKLYKKLGFGLILGVHFLRLLSPEEGLMITRSLWIRWG